MSLFVCVWHWAAFSCESISVGIGGISNFLFFLDGRVMDG